MPTIRRYKTFFYGRYFTEGIRITAGIAIPAFVFLYLGQLSTGIVLSLGALCCSIADAPGPILHRRNAMVAMIVLIPTVSIISSLAQYYMLTAAVCITVAGFVFSMLALYSPRVSAVGIASLVITVLSFEAKKSFSAILIHALLLTIGAMWYTVFSLALYRLRPYRLLQQSLADYIESVAEYLRARAGLYEKDSDLSEIFHRLAPMQTKIREEQGLVSEIIFKTREFTREASYQSRRLVKIYSDTAALFDLVISTHTDYNLLHRHFGNGALMPALRNQILRMADELSYAASAVRENEQIFISTNFTEGQQSLRDLFETMRKTEMNSSNLENYVAPELIIQNLELLGLKLEEIYTYSNPRKKIKQKDVIQIGADISEPTNLNLSLFFSNLNFDSNIFRHSIRVAVALLMGYLISLFTKTGHSYWILLTVVVILKPSYSLSKQRNTDRLIGTFAGLITGSLLLLLIQSERLLAVIMLLLMIVSYTYLRTKYLVSVWMLSAYILLFFAFLYPHNIFNVLADRIIDTSIASLIAFLVSLFLLPRWEHESSAGLVAHFLEKASEFYDRLSSFQLKAKTEGPRPTTIEMFTALANMSGSFTRMLSEPKRYQKNMQAFHRLVVLSQLLSAHLAALQQFIAVNENQKVYLQLEKYIADTKQNFYIAVQHLRRGEIQSKNIIDQDLIEAQLHQLIEKRKQEIKSGMLETETKHQLIYAKAISDQFKHVCELTSTIARTSEEMN